MRKTREVFILLTEKKVHIYGSWSRAIKVHQRARRMGAEHEYMSGEVKAGDPYRGVKVKEYGYGSSLTERNWYCAEATS